MSEYQRFLADNGEEKRYEYDLNTLSTVWDVGGYKGDFADNIFKKFGCMIEIFEPAFYTEILERFTDEMITVHGFGVSNRNCSVPIYLKHDSTSLHGSGFNVMVQLIDIYELMDGSRVDLIKINVEGEEYNILERMIEKDIAKYFKNIQIQFHKFVPNAEARMKSIQTELSKTHELTWQYEFIWENWRLK